MAKSARLRFDYETYGPLIALAVLVVAAALSSPYFCKLDNLLNILRQISYSGIIALGMTFVIIAGGIDLSVGSMTALAGGLVILSLNRFSGMAGPEHAVVAIVGASAVGVLVGAAAGAVNGFLVTIGRVAAFIATLGTMAIFRSLTLQIADAGEFRSECALFPELGMGRLLGVPNPVWAFAALALLFSVILHNTRYGRYVCAVGSNARVATYAAIPVNLVRFLSYVICGLTVGVSAVFFASRMNSISSTNAGVSYELDAIAAVIIGGTSMAGGRGTIWGTVIGAIILGIVNNMLNMVGVSPYLQGTVKGLVIIAAVLIQRKKA